eukprot:gb/GEZN01004134.1/.p1 GENE.gb/GEZN01004134.1/~~gb/GEZN01004134.1/.p1  ORF type:complete len:627 (-),score=52.81 gb/GEZN01004134.1/:63-1943(-)
MWPALILLSGIAGVKAQDRCAVYPDPHFRTWDGFYYDFHYPCDFELVTNAGLSVHVRLSRAQGSPIALIEGVAIKLGSDKLSLELDSSSTSVHYNGGLAGTFPLAIGSMSVVAISPDEYVMSFAGTTDSIHVTKFYGSLSVELNGQGSESVFWKAKGLCGSYNGDPADDLTSADGSALDVMSANQAEIDKFGWTWRVDPTTSSLFSKNVICNDTQPGGSRDVTQQMVAEAKRECLVVAGSDLALDPELLKDCIEDIVLTGDKIWAGNPIYQKPMRCSSTCECTNLHPKAVCLDRCLIDHDCIRVCPDKRCTCNVPKKIPSNLTCDDTIKIISTTPPVAYASLVGPTIGSWPNLCKIVDATKCTSCACTYYVKYSNDGGATWLGLTFGGTPGGTGCPGTIAGSTALDKAVNWLKSKYIDQGYCCGKGTGISCKELPQPKPLNPTPLIGAIVGDAPKLCKIVDATKCSSCACSYYVKYSTDNGVTWLGLTFGGNPGGTGCPAASYGTTASGAVNWLYDKYVAQGYCCGTPHIPCNEVATAPSASLIGPIIGSGNQVCKIVNSTSCTACACDYYVKYSTDGGLSWLGLNFGGVPVGTGCPNGNPIYQGANGAVKWLTDKYIPRYCCLQT